MRPGASRGFFVGRGDEQTRFQNLLSGLARTGPVRDGPSWVVLVHGPGGIGKSALLQRFRQMAAAWQRDPLRPQERCLIADLDWEDSRAAAPADYPGSGPRLVVVLNRVLQCVTDAFARVGHADRAERSFDAYRGGVALLREWERQLARLYVGANGRESALDQADTTSLLDVAGSLANLLGGNPVAAVNLGTKTLGQAASASIKLTSNLRRFLRGTARGYNDPDLYALETDTQRELARRMAAGLRSLSGAGPLVIVLDTYEIVQSQGQWLREVMQHTGGRVAWVIGARFSTYDGGSSGDLERFHRTIPSEHLLPMPLERLDDESVVRCLRHWAPKRSLAPADVERISGYARGVPLAVYLAARMLALGVPVETVCASVDDQREPARVVRDLATRYLIHADDKYGLGADRHRIHGLALLYGDQRSDPEALRALWGDDGDLAAYLMELVARHDFVLVGGRLHQDVRDAVRVYLMDPLHRESVRPSNERAAAVMARRLARRRDLLVSLDERASDETYLRDVLALIWHRFWIGNDLGWRTLLEVLPVLGVLAEGAAATALDLAAGFVAAGSETEGKWLDWLSARSAESGAWPPIGERRFEVTGPGLDLLERSAYSHSDVVTTPAERRAALAVLRARLAHRTDGEHGDAALVSNDVMARLRIGFDVTVELAGSLQPDEVIGHLIRRAATAVDAERATLLLIQGEEAVVVDAYDRTGQPAPTGARFPISELLSGGEPVVQHAIRGRRPRITGPLEVRGLQAVSEWGGPGQQHTLTLPLVIGGAVVAVLLVSRFRDEAFRHDDALTLQLIGNVAVLALRNAQLFAAAQEASHAGSDFLTMTGHELRTPLTVIKGYLSMLSDGSLGDPPEGLRQPVELLTSKAQELSVLVDDLLFAARIEDGRLPVRPKWLDLSDAARDAVSRAEARVRLLDAEMVLKVPAEPLVVRADPEHVARVLDNLIDNALTYRQPGQPPWIGIEVRVDEGAAAVCVEDRGRGIPSKMRERIFERFVRGDETGPHGTGLGLYISRRLAAGHGGSLRLDTSVVGKGSRFSLRLPLRRR